MRLIIITLLSLLSLSWGFATPLVSVNVESIGGVSCFGVNDGFIQISVDGGALPLSYVWSNGATTKNINNLNGGDYKVTVTDMNGASVISQDIQVASPLEPMSVALNFVQSLSCPDSDDGSIEVTVYGGTAPYSYLWSNGATDEDPTGLAPGNYTFTVTDNNGCLWPSPTVSVNAPTPMEMDEIIMGSNAGSNDGSVYVDINGGLPPYQYIWDNGENTPSIMNLEAGTYCLTITDAYSCIINECFEVSSITSNDEISNLENLSLSPNPAEDFTVLELTLNAPEQVQVEIVDMNGRQLFSEDIGKITYKQVLLDTEQYTPGLYFAKIAIGNQVLTKKLVVK